MLKTEVLVLRVMAFSLFQMAAATKVASSVGRTIKTVTVIGGGLMGSGIAQARLLVCMDAVGVRNEF